VFHPIRVLSAFLPERVRAGLGRRATGLVLTLLVEALLLLLLLTLNHSNPPVEEIVPTITRFGLNPTEEPDTETPETAARESQPAQPEEAQPQPQPEAAPPERVPPALLPFTRRQMADTDIASIPSRRPPAPSATVGPPAPAVPADTPRMGGSGPNGEPLYAAAWYREPTNGELAGYLSTSRGPGWGLIACRTVAEYRVEDCVIVDEYPRGSNIGRSVLAASWQFRVRPPRIGGRSMVGTWVGIRIDYDIRRQ
jgi:protein TonB